MTEETGNKRKLNASEAATILVALRVLQIMYKRMGPDQVRADWQLIQKSDQAEDRIEPLTVEEIESLGDRLSRREVEL